VLEFENCTFGNVEGPVQPISQYSLPVRQAVLGLPHLQRYSFSISRKIQARESPENTKEKNQAGLQVGTMDVTTFTCTDYVVVPIT
jgi:hypothetical protein